MLAVENLYGDLSTTRLTEITREFGCVSQASIAGTGSDVIFLSQRGIISLRQTEFGISQSVVVPLSDQITTLPPSPAIVASAEITLSLET